MDKEIMLQAVDSLLDAHNLVRAKGTSFRPIYSHVVMDRVLQIYCTSIKGANLKFMQKKLKKDWSRLYHQFNMVLFNRLNADQTSEVVEMMDGLEIAVNDDLQAVYGALRALCAPHCGDMTEVCVSCLVADIYCKVANKFWTVTFGGENETLLALQRTIVKLMDICYNGFSNIKTNNDERVATAVDALCQHITRFQIEYEQK